jgi:hypothetical protein
MTGLLKSKTFWFNIAIALVGVIEAQANVLRPMFASPFAFMAFCMAVSVGGIVLRIYTTKALSEK